MHIDLIFFIIAIAGLFIVPRIGFVLLAAYLFYAFPVVMFSLSGVVIGLGLLFFMYCYLEDVVKH